MPSRAQSSGPKFAFDGNIGEEDFADIDALLLEDEEEEEVKDAVSLSGSGSAKVKEKSDVATTTSTRKPIPVEIHLLASGDKVVRYESFEAFVTALF